MPSTSSRATSCSRATALLDDPGYVLFGRLAAMGMRPIGVPRGGDGLDVERLEALAKEHRPKLFMTNSVLHNPTGTSLGAADAFRVLRLAEAHDFHIVEDDILADLHPGRAHRIAQLDQLNRVIYVGSFRRRSARACGSAISPRIPTSRATTAQKMLAGLTTPSSASGSSTRCCPTATTGSTSTMSGRGSRARSNRRSATSSAPASRSSTSRPPACSCGRTRASTAPRRSPPPRKARGSSSRREVSSVRPRRVRPGWFHVAYAGSPKLAKFFESLR